jgi:hypothetical protein
MTITAGTAQSNNTGFILSSVCNGGLTDRIATCSRSGNEENGAAKSSRHLFRSAKKENGMSEYRVYTIGPDGHIFKADHMICDNDDEAISRVRVIVAEHPVEIWSGSRFVIRLDPAR